jgi:hypothetical protein
MSPNISTEEGVRYGAATTREGDYIDAEGNIFDREGNKIRDKDGRWFPYEKKPSQGPEGLVPLELPKPETLGGPVCLDGALPIFKLSLSDPEVAKSAEVIKKALEEGKPDVLTRGEGREAAAKKRYESQKKKRSEDGPPKDGNNYDEYPFASTKEGGAGAHISEIPAGPNQEAGRRLGRFYEGTGEYAGQPPVNPGQRFRVVIVP